MHSRAIPEEREIEVSMRELSESTEGGQSQEMANQVPAPPLIARLVSIDETAVSGNLVSLESIGAKSQMQILKKQDSTASNQSSITSFTALAAKRHKDGIEIAEKPDDDEDTNDDVFTDTNAQPPPPVSPKPVAEKPQPVPRKMKLSTSSNSLNNILSDSRENLNDDNSFTTLPRDKPKPKPRLRKSESDTKARVVKNHAYEDIDGCRKPDNKSPPASTRAQNEQQ